MNVKNRGCIRRLSFKTLLASRKRNLIAIAAIVLTTLLFTSLFTVAMSINSSYEMYTFRQVGGYSHGTFKEVSEEQAKAIADHPKVKAVGLRTNIGIMDSGVFAKVPAEVSFMDENCTIWSFAQPDTGHMPQSGKEITMDTGALRLLGIEPKLGAQIPLTFTVGDKNQSSYEKTDTFTLTGWWEYDDISPVHYINVSQEYAQAVEAEGIAAGMNPFRTDLNVMMASAVDIRGQMEQVDTDLGYTWEQDGSDNVVRLGVNWGYTTAQLGESIDATTVLAILAFLALVIFTGYLIIYNIFQISVTGDIRYYGLLKTIGVTPRQLRQIIRQQALLLCAVGIPMGLLLGYGVGALLTPVVMAQTTFGAGITTISTSPLIFLASALFALVTVLLSCARPGRIAAKVSPVEATKYTEAVQTRKKRRTTRGAKVHQMAYANLGRNKSKTILVVISLALSVVLLNILVTFTNGFDMEKYLAKQTCADFIVSSTDYFRYSSTAESYLSADTMEKIAANTSQSLSGCGYKVSGAIGWMPETQWRRERTHFGSPETVETELAQHARRGELVSCGAQIEGLDESLFEKLTVVKGDLAPLFREGSNAIAMTVYTDDYGNVSNLDQYPEIGTNQTITYVEDSYISANGGAAMLLTDSYGKTKAENLNLGLYLVVETKVPEMVVSTTDPFLVSVPMTSVNGTNATDGGTRWIYDITLYPKNLTGIPSLEKTLRENKNDTGKHQGSASSITDGYAHTGTASAGDTIDYQIISTLPSITSESTYLSCYTFVDTLSMGLTYNKGDVVLEFFTDSACTDSVAKWTEADGKFAVAYNTTDAGESVMTIEMTAAGLNEINTSKAVYSGASMVNSGYSDCTLRITYAAKMDSSSDLVFGDKGNDNKVVLTWKRSSQNYYDTLVDDCHVFSYGIDLTKLFSDGKGDFSKVEFLIQNKTDSYFVKAELNKNDGVYYVVDHVTDKAEATHFVPVKTADAQGRIIVKGLEDDTYTMTEVRTDNGYVMLKQGIDVVISQKNTDASCGIYGTDVLGLIQNDPRYASIINDSGDLHNMPQKHLEHKLLTASAAVDGKKVTMLEDNGSVNAEAPLTVVNTRGFDLPKTGDHGTFVFTVVGILLMAGAVSVIALVCRKKRSV